MAKAAPRRKQSSKRDAVPLSTWGRIATHWQVAIVIASGVAAIGAATTVVVKFLPYTEPWWYATHAHVDEKVTPVDQKTDVLMYWKLDDAKNTAKREEGGWAVQLQKETDPKQKELIQRQIDHAVADQRKYDARIQQLKVPDWVK